MAMFVEERGRIAAALAELAVQTLAVGRQLHPLPADAHRGLARLWSGPPRPSVLVRDCSSWPGLERLPPGHGRAPRRTTASSPPCTKSLR